MDAGSTSSNPLIWMLSGDDEVYYESEGSTREETEQQGRDVYGENFSVGLGCFSRLPKEIPLTWEDLDETLADSFYEVYLSETITKEAADELMSLLNSVWSGWLEKHRIFGTTIDFAEGPYRYRDGILVE